MSGRRSDARYTVSPPSAGAVRVLLHADIESVGQGELSVICREAATVDERMVVEVPGDAVDRVMAVQVLASRPIVVSNAVRHLLQLRVLDAGSGEPLQATAGGQLAVLAREFPVRLVNCSRSGCLFEADSPLDPGTVGTLSLVIDGHELADHILVVRSQPLAGAGPVHHIGARLLWVEAPSAHAIRRGLSAVENPV